MNKQIMNSDPIYSYQPLWGAWTIDSQIGEGSYGKVYKALRTEFGYTYTSAVKIITIPSKEQLRQALSSFGDDKPSLKAYFAEMVSNIIKEINILYRLKSCHNIVSYEDHSVIEKKDDLGWDILIRMEYLTPLAEYLLKNRLPIQDIINLSLDILNAISVCYKSNIIHRDIKDENIFVSENKTFKLGDFGIARELSKSGKASSFKGTPMYMSPEVFKSEKYDIRSDIYSLGLVLYKLTNKGRLPFMPSYPDSLKYSDTEAAIDKRLSGSAMPLPSHSGKELGAIILKACSYKPENRYADPKDMTDDIKNLKLDRAFLNKDVTHIGPKVTETIPVYPIDSVNQEEDKIDRHKEKQTRNKGIKKGLVIGLSISLAIILAAAGYFIYSFFKNSMPKTESVAAATTTVQSQTTETLSKAQDETAGSTAGTEIIDQASKVKTINTGVLTVGSDCSWPPMEYIEGGKIVGFDVDLTKAITERLVIKLDYQNIVWNGLFSALAVHKFDMAISSITITDDRKKQMDFSDPYYITDQTATVKKDSGIDSVEKLNGKKAGVLIGTTGETIAKKMTGVTVKTYNDILMAFEDLNAGRIDAVVCDSYFGDTYSNKNPDFNIGFKVVTNEQFGICFAKDTPELVIAVNNALKSIKDDGTYDKIFAMWFAASELTQDNKNTNETITQNEAPQ